MKSGSGDSVPRASADSSLQDLPVIVAGSLTAGLVFIFLLGVLIYHCVKNKKKRQKEQNYSKSKFFFIVNTIGKLEITASSHQKKKKKKKMHSPLQKENANLIYPSLSFFNISVILLYLKVYNCQIRI